MSKFIEAFRREVVAKGLIQDLESKLSKSFIDFAKNAADYASFNVRKLIESLTGDEKLGAEIVLKSLYAPLKQICKNAGINEDTVLEKVLELNNNDNFIVGYDALNDKYVNMIECGIIDPTKVTRSALQNAVSVSATLLTTESLVTEIKDNKNKQNES